MIASIAVGGLLVVGLPTMAFADPTDAPADPTTSESTDAATTESEATTEVTETAEPSEEPAETPSEEPTDTPSETPTEESTPPSEEPAEEPVTEEEPATEEPTAEPQKKAAKKAADEGEVNALVVPEPGAGEAVITVRTGDVRSLSDPNSISALQGVQLGLYTTRTGGTQLFTCTADADGDCNFVIPNTGDGGVNRDREMWVRQISAPGTHFTNPSLRTGDAFGGDNQQTSYSFRVGALIDPPGPTPAGWQIRAGNTYGTTPPAEFMVGTGNTNRDASGGVWQSSRVNPLLPQQCGLDVALIMDLSGSVNPAIVQARAAGVTLVNSLVGTPSRVGLFTFAQSAPAPGANNQNRSIASVSNQPAADIVNGYINGLTAPTSGTTNWDRGLWQVANSPTQYDVAIILTDGNPTVYGTETTPGNFTRTREVENAVFSANSIKSEATRVIALGVGSGVTNADTALNLRAISGGIPFNGSNATAADYYQTADYAAAGAALKQIALGNCQGAVSVTKAVVPPGGTIDDAQAAGGWAISATEPSTGVTVNTPNPADGLTAPVTGVISYPLDFAGGTNAGTVVIRETQQSGHTVIPQGALNATCRDLNTDTPIAGVTNNNSVPGQPGINVPVSPTTAVSCIFFNQAPNPAASVVVDKLWAVNGQPAVPNGSQDPSLVGNANVNGATTGFGTEVGGFTAGQSIPITEQLTQLPTTCELVSQRVTEVNDAGADFDLGGGAYSLTLLGGLNNVQITNTITCPTKLTLRKEVVGGGVATDLWTLDAINGPTNFPAGNDSGDGVTGTVTPGVVYALAESDGDPRYLQVDNRDPVLAVPGSTGSWACVPLDADGNPTGGNAGGLNGGVNVGFGNWVQCTAVNQTAQVELRKVVNPANGGDALPADWDLTAAPVDPPAGIVSSTVTSGTTILVRPGVTYELSEANGPAGYDLESLQCNVGPEGTYVDVTDITLDPTESAICVFTNIAELPKISLDKVVSPTGVADKTSWTLSASRADNATVVATGAGGTSGQFVSVPAGVAFNLAETTSLPNAGEFQAGTWQCFVNGGPAIAGPVLAALSPGDEASCVVTNTLKPVVPTITKTAAVPTPNADGSWNVGYDIVVTNPSNFQDLTYSLTDQLKFGSNVTVNSASYQNTLPAPPGASTSWTVPFTDVQAFAGEPTLVKGTSHTWHVTVNATVAPGTDFGGTSPTACDAGTPGTVGFLNTAVMTVAGVDYPAQDCTVPVKPTIAKVGGTAVDNGDGTWTLPYRITVTNPSATTGVVYDLGDALDLPAAAEIVGTPVVVAKPAGVTTVPTWTGQTPNTLLADDIALAGGAAAHVYDITVTVRLDSDDAEFICPSADGLNNTATVVAGNQSTDATGCVVINPPTITHTKSVVPGSVSQAVDGTWSIAYDIVVTNTGAVGGVYDLADTTHFGTGITGGTYSATKNGAPIAGWTNGGVLADNAYLAAGDPDPSDTYRITVTGIAVAGPELTPAQTACPTGPGSGAFLNTATLTVAGVDTDKSACETPSAPKIVKSGATASQQPDATWNVTYTLTVSNTDPGAKPSFYTLTDDPAFPAGVDYLSYAIDGGAPVSPYDGSEFTVVEDQAIAAGEVDVYTVVLNVDAPSGAVAPEELECQSENNPDGVGFLNEGILTSGEIVRTDEDCTEISRGGEPTVEKGDPTVTQGGDGVWTLVYDVTVTGNAEFVSRYVLDDTLRFGPEVDILSAEWENADDPTENGTWTDPEAEPTTTIVGTPRVIGIDAVHSYTVTVTAEVDEAAFADPATNTCSPSEGDPNVGFLNEVALTTPGGQPTYDTGCGLPAKPEVTKTFDGPVTGDASEWTASYTITVHNTSDDQELVYDLSDTPDFADGVVITGASVTSSDVTVNPGWNGDDDTTVVTDEPLAGGATHTFTVTVTFTVDADAPAEGLVCAGDGTDGHGLLNLAVVTSGDDYEADDCGDVPVTVEVTKFWVINGGAPIAWDSDQLPAGFGATLVLDDVSSDWDTVYGPYTAGGSVNIDETDVATPEGARCSLDADSTTGLGDEVLEGAVNEFEVVNYVDCTQSVTLTKVVDNQHGGDAVAEDWTLSGENVGDDTDTFSGDGTANGTVEVGVGYALNEVSTIWEDGVEYEVSATWTCESDLGEDAFTLVAGATDTSATLTVNEFGASVECEITNTDIAPELTLVKVVEPEDVATDFPPTLWTLTASDNGTPVLSGDGGATGAVDSNVAYDLAEAASFDEAGEFTASDWTCVNAEGAPIALDDSAVTLQPGDDVTCTITNTALPATYTFEKTVTSAEQQPDGTWLVEYSIEVENTSGVSPLEYDLVDTLDQFGEGITVDEASWTSSDGRDGEWAGLPDDLDATLAEGQALGAGETHTYDVTVVATVTEGAWTEDTTQCSSDEMFEPGGFRNVATLTVDDLPTVRTDCDEPGTSFAEKQVAGEPVYNGDGTFDVSYEITVSNASDKDQYYDLSDTPAFPAGTTFTAEAFDPAGDPVVGWTGVAPDAVLADGRLLPAGTEGGPTVEVWTITATVKVDTITNIDDAKCVEDTSGHGFYNGGEFTTGTITTPISDCVDIPIVDVGIEKTALLPDGVTAVDDTEDNTFDWVLTVTNNGVDVQDLEVTDLIDPQLEITGPATFEAPENWTESTVGNQFTANYTGTFVEGQVATITIPVRVLPVVVDAPPAVGPDDPAPVLPDFPENQVIPNLDACVATSGYEPPAPGIAALALEVPEGNVGDIFPDNDCADAEVPVKKVDAGAYVRCVADVPWLYYDVRTTENVTPGDITVTWTSADGTQTKVQTIPWDDREGRLLWPGAAVDADGLPYQFPGWRPITEEDLTNPPTPGTRFLDLILDDSLPSYAWRDMENPASIEFSVNPSQTVLAVYPQALPTCAVDRPAELDIEKTASVASTKADGDFSYSLQVTSVGTGATDPTEVFDEIPTHLRVDEITTAPAPAFPRWEDCEVTGQDSSGYGGTLHCDLLGQLGPNFTTAPVIDLAVHVKPGTTVSTIDNTGEVCWQTADDPDPVTECADDTVTVTLLGGTAVTGFSTGPWIWGAAGLLFLGGLAVVWVMVRRRREAAGD
ncbi:hypothetical protein [Agromyces sp. Marseille-Q5079]|uniref:hypothetical protein n=1 Tax=Agromyces sp. Marseille-Q5079 TaxID=3439059 RepID=UPI003D9CAAD8